MKPRDKAIQALNEGGYFLERHGKKHDQYYNPTLRCTIPLKRHDFDEDDLRYIMKEIKQNGR
ncbi:MAG: hypothetical protein LUG61_08895 [Lachnospiraceae bacterium]|nr:hypothetical protein [Lachnospiraceae bacterium]MCD7863600.1 hypothetical protein [Lachnospiraceae bacterium]